MAQLQIERVLTIRLIKAMVSIRPTGEQSNRAKASKLVVNGMEVSPLMNASSCTYRCFTGTVKSTCSSFARTFGNKTSKIVAET